MADAEDDVAAAAGGRRHSKRKAPRVSYADPILAGDDGEDEEDTADLDEETLEKKRRATYKALRLEREAQKKATKEDKSYSGGSGLANANKRRKKDAKSSRKRKQAEPKPDIILTLPLDLLATIFSLLKPIDVLQLSRVNKSLHSWLSSKEPRSVWTAARRNMTFTRQYDYDRTPDNRQIVLPSPPANLSNASYAKLCFEETCYHCVCRMRQSQADFALQKRLCSTCRHLHVKTLSELKTQITNAGGSVDPVVLEIVPSDGTSYYVPSVVRAHEEVQKKKKELSKDAYKCTKWQKRFKKYYQDDGEIQAQERAQEISMRRTQLASYVRGQEWFNGTVWVNYLQSQHYAKILNGRHPVTEAEWTEISDSIRVYFEQIREFDAERLAYDKGATMRNWVITKFRQSFGMLGVSAPFSLPPGDVYDLPSLQEFLTATVPAGSHDTGWVTPSPAVNRETFFAKCVNQWTDRVSEIQQEAGERKIKILGSFATVLAGAVTNSDVRETLEEALSIAKDDSYTQLERIEALTASLDTVYALFGCARCSNGYEPKALRLLEAFEHVHLVQLAVHPSYNAKAERRCATLQRPVGFQVSLLTAKVDAIDATEILVRACSNKREEYRKGSKEENTCLPKSLTQVKKVFDRNWRFTCHFEPSCNSITGRNAFTNLTYRKWDEMLYHVVEHRADGYRMYNLPFKISAIGIARIKKLFVSDGDTVAGDSDEEDVKPKIEDVSSPLSKAETSPPSSPLTELSALSDEEV